MVEHRAATARNDPVLTERGAPYSFAHLVALSLFRSSPPITMATDTAGPLKKDSRAPQTEIPTHDTKKRRRVLLVLTILPYLVGVVWHGLHPVASLLTGQDHPRGGYIDESNLDPNYFRFPLKHDPLEIVEGAFGLCSVVETACVSIDTVVDVAFIVPPIVAPMTELVVVVVPPDSPLLLSAVSRLITLLRQVPWLAKTILFVSPRKGSLHDGVDNFLRLFSDPEASMLLPDSLRGSLIRQILVLDYQPHSLSGGTTLRLLPQGRRGELPNMDLFFLVQNTYARSQLTNQRDSRILVHPYRNTLRWERTIEEWIPDGPVRQWALQLLPLLLFEYSLWGPYEAPHASAIDVGIDSMTLVLETSSEKNVSEYVQRLEIVLRCLSNLQERLHHSTSLYLLPESRSFVKHEEYLVPNLLLLVPLVVWVLSTIYYEPVDVPIVGWTALTLIGLVGILHVGSFLPRIGPTNVPGGLPIRVLILCLLPLLRSWFAHLCGSRSAEAATTRSVRLTLCLASLYVHVALAFGHVALAFPSALFWTPVLLTMSHDRWWSRVGKLIVLAVACPSLSLVPLVFAEYTPYVLHVYTPLYLLVPFLNHQSSKKPS